MLSRLEAAAKIEAAIEAAGYSTSVWAPEDSGGPVRVYVTIPAASWKKKARKIGYVAVELDGTVTANLDVQAGTILACLPEMQIQAAALPTARIPASDPNSEDVEAFTRSRRAMAAAEDRRIGDEG